MVKSIKERHDERNADSIIGARRLTFSEAARQLGVHVGTIWRWYMNRGLPSIKIGGRRYLLVEDLEAFLRRGRAPPPTSETELASTDARSDAAAEQLKSRGV